MMLLIKKIKGYRYPEIEVYIPKAEPVRIAFAMDDLFPMNDNYVSYEIGTKTKVCNLFRDKKVTKIQEVRESIHELIGHPYEKC